jgi:hypothetical protein
MPALEHSRLILLAIGTPPIDGKSTTEAYAAR